MRDSSVHVGPISQSASWIAADQSKTTERAGSR